MAKKSNKKMLMSYDERYGIMFGFPKCCTHAFVYDRDNLQEESEFIGTGFVTCKACHANKSTDTIIDEINKRRIFPVPFSLQINQEQKKYYNGGETFFSDALKLIDHDTDIQKLKERIAQVQVELTCYQYGSGSNARYWFAKNLIDSIYTYVYQNDHDRLVYLYLNLNYENSRSKCCVAPPEKAAELREKYPHLAQQTDFILV